MKDRYGMKLRLLALVMTVLALAVTFATAAMAVPPEPTYGTAVVDGDINEWNLVDDFFADMHRAGKIDKPLESKLYLRYDCKMGTMYVLILNVPGIPALTSDPSTAWIAIDAQNNKVVSASSNDDGVAPDFAWVGLGFDGDKEHAQGYEASFQIAEGKYQIIGHVNVFDAGAAQTSGTLGFPSSGPDLEIACGVVPVTPSTWSRVKSTRYR